MTAIEVFGDASGTRRGRPGWSCTGETLAVAVCMEAPKHKVRGTFGGAAKPAT